MLSAKRSNGVSERVELGEPKTGKRRVFAACQTVGRHSSPSVALGEDDNDGFIFLARRSTAVAQVVALRARPYRPTAADDFISAVKRRDLPVAKLRTRWQTTQNDRLPTSAPRAVVDRIAMEWPSHARQIVQDAGTDRTVTIPERRD